MRAAEQVRGIPEASLHTHSLHTSPDSDALSFSPLPPPAELDFQRFFANVLEDETGYRDWVYLKKHENILMPGGLDEYAFEQVSSGNLLIPVDEEFYTESELAELDAGPTQGAVASSGKGSGKGPGGKGGGKGGGKSGLTTAASKDAGGDVVSGQVHMSSNGQDYFNHVDTMGPEVEGAIMIALWAIVFSPAQRAALVIAGTARAAAFGFRYDQK